MIVEIQPHPLRGQVRAPGSKSATHRALICAALAMQQANTPEQAGSLLQSDGRCEDALASRRALRCLGIEFTEKGCDLLVHGRLQQGQHATIDCGESGSTLRFMLSVALAVGGDFRFVGAGKLMQRPMTKLIAALEQEGVSIEVQNDAILAKGKLTNRVYTLDGSDSSQSVSGLLMALPLLGQGASLHVIGEQVSRPYIDMTIQMLARFGITVVECAGVFTTSGSYRQTTTTIEGDWSAAAFWLTAGAIGGVIRVEGLPMDTQQGDASIVPMLTSMGAIIDQKGDAVRSTHGHLYGGEFDVEHVPDLVPTLCIAACYAQGITKITGAARLRSKESDRLLAMREVMEGLGGIAREEEDRMTIRGITLRGGEVDTWNDHRIAMAVAIAATMSATKVIVRGAECVNKSYPSFWDDFRSLGGNVKVLEG